MPIYEYECTICCKHFEEKQHFDDEPVAECPICKAKARRVLHSVPIVFKGSGFYVTDHGRGSGWNGERKDSQDTGAKKEETKTGTKAEAGAATKAVAKAETKAKDKD